MSSDMRIQESIAGFNTYLPEHAQKEALEKWTPVAKDREGQIEILDAAKAGDTSAINFLFLKTLPQISGVFWSNFLGPNPKWQRYRIAHEHAFDTFAGMAYEALLNDGSEGGAAPLVNFDPDKLPDSDDLINKFGWYMQQAMINESRKYNANRDRSGFTGATNSKKGERVPSVISLEGMQHTIAGGAERQTFAEVPDQDVSSEITSDLDAWGTFCEDELLDEGKSPTLREVLVAYLELQHEKGADWTMEDIKDALGTSTQLVYKRLKNIPDILEAHGLNQEGLAQLMSEIGIKELLDVLR